jgi:hypothetical protein
MRLSVALMAAAALMLGGTGTTLAQVKATGDTEAAHVPNRVEADQPKGSKAYAYVRGHRHMEIRREPPGGLIQDRGMRESTGKQPESLVPLNK